MKSSIKSMFFALVAAVCLLVTQRASAQNGIFGFSVALSGPAESPANASPGIGTGFVTIDTVNNTLQVHVDFSALTGTTTAAHIHSATAVPGVGTAGVATTTPTFAGFPLGVTSGTYDNTLDMTLASSYNPAYVTSHGGTIPSAEAALFASFFTGQAYLNLHSTTFAGGEIRGFLVAVPEPSTYAAGATALALVGLAFSRRRRGATL